VIRQIDWQGTPAYALESDKLIVSICPAIGNNVYSIWDKKLGREMLRTPSSPEELREQPVQYGTPILMPPNRIREGKFTFDGREYQFDRNNKITGNHIHGVIKSQPWTVRASGERDGSVFITSIFRTEGDEFIQRQYPHELEFELTYELSGGTLSHKLKVTNLGTTSAPFGYGLHTWFLLHGQPEKWSLQVPVSGLWELDETNIPLGTVGPLGRYDALVKGDVLTGYNLDTVFQIGDYPCLAVLSGEEVDIRYSGTDLFKQWVIFTKGVANEFICLEPYTWVTNAPNIDQPADITGLRGVDPGTPLELEVKLEVLHK
jgi:aldose 1-epimerase